MFHYSACRGQNRSLVFVEELVKLFCSNYRQNPQITAAVHYFQKQPPEVFCKKMCSLKVCKYHRKIPVLEPVFKSCRTWSLQLFYKETPTQVFSCEICEIVQNPILNSICERLLLYLHYNSHHHFHFYHFHHHQKQAFADVLHNRCSEKFCKFHRKAPALESLFNKVADLKPATLNKRRLQHRCFYVKFAKFLRTSFLTVYLRWLLLSHCKLHFYRLRILQTIPLDCNIIPLMFQLYFVFFLAAYIFL